MSTIRQLREIAKELGIKRYSRFTKSQLEAEIIQAAKKRNEQKEIMRLQEAYQNADRDPQSGLSFEECLPLVNKVIYTDNPRYNDEVASNAVWYILRDCRPDDRAKLARYIAPDNITWNEADFIDKRTVIKAINSIRDMASIVIDLMNAGRDISGRGGVCAVWQDNFNKHYHKGKYSQQEISTPETTTLAPDDEPEALYLDAEDLFSDHAGDNSAPLQDIPDDTLHDVPEITPASRRNNGSTDD